MAHPKCEDCRFWDTSVVSEDGAASPCRKLPPIADDRDHSARWPMTEETDWCGSFERDPNRVEEIDEPLAATPPDGAAEREADEGYRLECGRCEGSGQFPEGRTCLRCGGNGYDPVQPKPTPALTEAPAAGSAETRLAATGTAFRRWASEQGLDWNDDDLMQAFIAGTEHAALAARPAAVTDEMANEIATHVVADAPFNQYGVVTIHREDLRTRISAAALAARGPT